LRIFSGYVIWSAREPVVEYGFCTRVPRHSLRYAAQSWWSTLWSTLRILASANTAAALQCEPLNRHAVPRCRAAEAETNDGAGVVLMVAKLATVATTCGTRKTCLGVTVPASLHGRLMLPHGTGQSPPSVRKSDDLPDAFGP
jgi:hypothetical protein